MCGQGESLGNQKFEGLLYAPEKITTSGGCLSARLQCFKHLVCQPLPGKEKRSCRILWESDVSQHISLWMRHLMDKMKGQRMGNYRGNAEHCSDRTANPIVYSSVQPALSIHLSRPDMWPCSISSCSVKVPLESSNFAHWGTVGLQASHDGNRVAIEQSAIHTQI